MLPNGKSLAEEGGPLEGSKARPPCTGAPAEGAPHPPPPRTGPIGEPRQGNPADMLEAERQFRRVIGYRDLAKLAVAIERDLAPTTVPHPTEEAANLVTARPSHRPWGHAGALCR